MPDDNNLTTGRTQLNSQLLAGAKQLSGPALEMAQGASAFEAASNAIKDAALEKLLGPAAAFTGALTGSLLILRKIVRESEILEKGLGKMAALQQIQGKFETLLQSTTLAKQRIKELYEFTARSPFKFEDVAEANRQLQALTYGAFSGKKAMQLVGDSAAATGQSMSDMSERVGKMYAALSSGRSIDKIAGQLQYTGLATENLMTRLEKLEQSGASFGEMWAEVEKVLASNQGGMENEMKSLDALSTKLEESRADMQKAFAAPFVEAQSKAIETMTKATENLTPVLAQVGSDMAAVQGVFANFKTRIEDVTLASPGMAQALLIAWAAAKTLWVSLAAFTALNFAKNLPSFVAFGKASLDVAASTWAAAKASAAAEVATLSWSKAKEAAVAWDVRLAASQALLAGRFWATSAAQSVNAAGLRAVAGASGLAAVTNYLLGASVAVAGGAFRLASIAAGYFFRQLVAGIAGLGVMGGLVTVAVAVAGALIAVKRGAAEARKEFDQMSEAIADSEKKLSKLLDSAQNTDDWVKYMTAATEEIAAAGQALDDLRKKVADKGFWDKAWGSVTGKNTLDKAAITDAETHLGHVRLQRKQSVKKLPLLGMGLKESEAYARDIANAQATSTAALDNKLQNADDDARVKLLEAEAKRLGDVADAAYKVRDAYEKFDRSGAKTVADVRLTDARDGQSRAQSDLKSAGVSSDVAADDNGALARERARIIADAAKGRQTREMVNGKAVYRSAGPGEDDQKRIEAIDKAIAANDELKASEKALADIRRNSESQLVKNNQEIDDIKAKGAGQTDADKERLQDLQKQNILLIQQKDNADQLATAEQQRKNDLKIARDTRDANAAGAAVDPAILAATAAGNDALVAQLQMKRDLAVIQERLNQANRDGNTTLAQALKLQAAMIVAAKAASDARYQHNAALDRAANEAAIRGDKKGAQGFKDEQTLEEKEREYAANGMTKEQAQADWSKGILADAAGQTPAVVASSMQAIGGGGGFSSGQDPVLAAQERIAKAVELNNAYLAKLVDAAKGSAGS